MKEAMPARRGIRPEERIRIKRTYDPPARGDGRRVLVERLWPRGMKKEDLVADAWAKEVAPSTALRKWFDHRVERWEEFRRRYRDELNANPDGWRPILPAGRRGRVTLLYSAHDALHNGAVVLRDYLSRRSAGRPSSAKRPRRRRSSRTTAARKSSPAGRTRGVARRRVR
jgi:uncharacterized protein YeaO (DUF488 family)